VSKYKNRGYATTKKKNIATPSIEIWMAVSGERKGRLVHDIVID
jgi:hypothetical protein